MAKKNIGDLDKDERAELVALTQKGRPDGRTIKRAPILFLANAGKPDFEIAELVHTSWLNVAEVEISVLTEQCFEPRLCSQVIAANQVGARESDRNAVWAKPSIGVSRSPMPGIIQETVSSERRAKID
jgi:hypothetical protein